MRAATAPDGRQRQPASSHRHPAPPAAALPRYEFRAMGSRMSVILDVAGAERELPTVQQWFTEWERTLSRFDPESELSRLNRTPEVAVPVSDTLWDVVDLALAAAEATDGIVTPAVLSALESAGYDRSFELLAYGDRTVRLPSPVAVPCWRRVRLTRRPRTIWLERGARLDLGGIGKGWAADRAAALLAERGPALVDAGGDIAVNGPPVSVRAWRIAIGSPFDEHGSLGEVEIERGGVATSGVDHRRWRAGGAWQHHLIDPRTGLPAATDVVSTTVIAPSAVEAEIAAKTLVILGSNAGRLWLAARPQLAAVLVLQDGSVLTAGPLSSYRWSPA